MSLRKWGETKQQPSRARSGHQLICCLVFLHFPVRHPIQSPSTTTYYYPPLQSARINHRLSVHSAKACQTQTDRRTCELEFCDITLRRLSSIAGRAIGQKTEKDRCFEVSFAIIAVRVRVRRFVGALGFCGDIRRVARPSFVRRPSVRPTDRHRAAAVEEDEEEDLADQPSV